MVSDGPKYRALYLKLRFGQINNVKSYIIPISEKSSFKRGKGLVKMKIKACGFWGLKGFSGLTCLVSVTAVITFSGFLPATDEGPTVFTFCWNPIKTVDKFILTKQMDFDIKYPGWLFHCLFPLESRHPNWPHVDQSLQRKCTVFDILKNFSPERSVGIFLKIQVSIWRLSGWASLNSWLVGSSWETQVEHLSQLWS